MSDWYSTIYKACILSAAISFIIGFLTVSNTSLGAYIAGYSVLTLGVLMILVILFSNILKVTVNDSMTKIIYSILMTAGPFIFILGIIGFVLFLLISYKNNIISGHISPSYNSFSNIIVMLLLLQMYLVYNNVSSDRFQATGKMSTITSGIIYLLCVITAISSIILYTILKYYSTDGFQTINVN
jgi:hypothetical protein